jgi:hypothetical protein
VLKQHRGSVHRSPGTSHPSDVPGDLWTRSPGPTITSTDPHYRGVSRLGAGAVRRPRGVRFGKGTHCRCSWLLSPPDKTCLVSVWRYLSNTAWLIGAGSGGGSHLLRCTGWRGLVWEAWVQRGSAQLTCGGVAVLLPFLLRVLPCWKLRSRVEEDIGGV